MKNLYAVYDKINGQLILKGLYNSADGVNKSLQNTKDIQKKNEKFIFVVESDLFETPAKSKKK
jgi:hypothetical protein